MKVHEAIARCFVAEGVDRIFTLLGDTNMAILASIDPAAGVQIVHARHEGAAMAMAEGQARATGRPAVCSTTAGPGLANALVSLTSAVRSGTPMVVLANQHARGDRGTHQAFDHEGLVRLTGARYRLVSDPATVVEATRAAFYEAAAGSTPVVLDVPSDVQDADYPWPFAYAPSGEDLIPPQRTPADPAALAAAAALLAASERPVLLAGRGAADPAARHAIAELAARAGALLATTLPVRGLFAGDPYDLGVAGLFSWPTTSELFAEADCVVAFGASLNHFTIAGGYLFPGAQVVHVDTKDQQVMGHGARAQVYVRGDAATVAGALAARLGDDGPRRERFRRDDVRAALAAAVPDDAPFAVGPGLVDPRPVCEVLDEALPPACGLVIGGGHFWGFPIMHMSRYREPLLFSYHFGAIGQAFPMALGAALADPTRPMALIEGDASVLMQAHELETLARYHPHLLVVVMDDAALGAEHHKLAAKGWDAELGASPPVAFAAVAEAYGCPAETITDEAQVAPAVDRFLAGTGPLLLDVKVARDVVSVPYRRLYLAAEH